MSLPTRGNGQSSSDSDPQLERKWNLDDARLRIQQLTERYHEILQDQAAVTEEPKRIAGSYADSWKDISPAVDAMYAKQKRVAQSHMDLLAELRLTIPSLLDLEPKERIMRSDRQRLNEIATMTNSVTEMIERLKIEEYKKWFFEWIVELRELARKAGQTELVAEITAEIQKREIMAD